jgi:ribosome-binding factor A
MVSERLEKINRLLYKEISQLLEDEFRGQFISVTAVETSADLSASKVWVSIYLQKDPESVLNEIQKKAPFFHFCLKKRLALKTIPHLQFILDHSLERTAKIDQILKENE